MKLFPIAAGTLALAAIAVTAAPAAAQYHRDGYGRHFGYGHRHYGYRRYGYGFHHRYYGFHRGYGYHRYGYRHHFYR